MIEYLSRLIPDDKIRFVAEMGTDDEALTSYQQNAWFNVSVLKALHIENELKQTFQWAGIKPDSHVLDVGCGAAIKARFLLEFGVASVSGIDNDPDELALARRLPNPHGDRLRLIEGDVFAGLPFNAHTFDAIFIGDGFIDFYDDALLAELKPLLRPGGVILLATTNILPGTFYSWARAFAARVETARWQSIMYSAYGDMVAETGATYERQFLALCARHRMTINHSPVVRRYPFSRITEQLIQQNFAAFVAGGVRPYLARDDWQHLLNIHDPNAPDYLFRREDAQIVELLTVATARLPLKP